MKLNTEKKYLLNNSELALVRILADEHGTPVSYAVSAAGFEVCSKVMDLLPNEEFSTVVGTGEHEGVCGICGIVNGREECLMLFDLYCALKEAENNG